MSRHKQTEIASLRQRAERKWTELSALSDNNSADDMRRLLQELQIHQIELEMQNEELRQAQLELAVSRDRYADLYDFAPMAYLTLNERGGIEEANLTAAAMLGTSRVALLKANITRFIDSESQDTMYLHLRSLHEGDRGRRREQCDIVMQRNNGEKITVHLESMRIDAQNNALCRTVLMDITQQVILADALRASEERYRRISNAVSDYIYHIPFSDGRRGKIIPDTNSEIVTGYRADELVTMSDPTRVIVHPEDWPEIERKQNALVADIDVSSGEYRIVTKQGETRWVSHVLSAQRDQSGKLVGYDGILRDITDKKIAQLTLRNLNLELDKSLAIRTSQLHETAETVKLLATAMNSLLEGVIIAQRSPGTDDYAVVFANKAMSAMSGYKRRELVGKSLTELRFLGIASDSASAPGESPDPASQSRHSQLKSVRLTADDGRVYDTEVLTSPIYAADGGVTHLVAVYRDISARKVAELELHRRNEQIKAILDTVADAIITIDIEGDIRDVNHITSGLFGYTSQELLGSNITKLLPSVIPGAAMSPITIFAKKISSRPGGQYREYTAQRKDRSSMPIGLNIREIDDSGLFTCVIRDLTLVKSLQRQILDVVEEENRRIGRELHDSIQQQLVGIRLLADSLLSETDEQSQTPPQPLSRLLQALDHTIGDLRILCRGMVSIDMDGDGLRAALSQLATGIEESNGIRCSFNSTGKIILKTPVIAGHIYRIAQEAVTNALKHANARAIAITLRANAGRLILEVCDDGIGIRDEDLERGGMGLQIMYYRAGLISGNLKIYCLDTGGTRLICSVPVSPLPLERSQGEIWGFFL